MRNKKSIFIDLTGLSRKITGIENYALNISKAYLNHCPADVVCHLIFRNYVHDDFKEFSSKHKLILSPFKSQFLTEQIYIPFYLAIHNFSFSFFPCFPPGLLAFGKIVFICFDATMWKFKETISMKNKLYFKPLTEIALKNAKKVFTISKSAEQEICTFYPSLQSKIHNIYAALPESFSRPTFVDFSEIKNKFVLKKKYILSVGSLEPRKNILFLIKAIKNLLKERDLQLVLVGRKAWGSSEIEMLMEDMQLNDHIVLTGYVSTKELQTLYHNAESFVYPSVYEGFGFPLLEAFSCGCAVIASNTSSIPEVVGDAALLFKPNSKEELLEKLVSILDNKELKQKYITLGYDRVQFFSWEKVATNFIKIVNQL